MEVERWFEVEVEVEVERGGGWRLKGDESGGWRFVVEVGGREMVQVGGWRARGNKVEVGGVNEKEA